MQLTGLEDLPLSHSCSVNLMLCGLLNSGFGLGAVLDFSPWTAPVYMHVLGNWDAIIAINYRLAG